MSKEKLVLFLFTCRSFFRNVKRFQLQFWLCGSLRKWERLHRRRSSRIWRLAVLVKTRVWLGCSVSRAQKISDLAFPCQNSRPSLPARMAFRVKETSSAVVFTKKTVECLQCHSALTGTGGRFRFPF